MTDFIQLSYFALLLALVLLFIPSSSSQRTRRLIVGLTSFVSILFSLELMLVLRSSSLLILGAAVLIFAITIAKSIGIFDRITE